MAVRKRRPEFLVGLFILAGLFLPASWLASILPVQSPEPFDSLTALVLCLRASLALVIAAVMLYLGHTFYETGKEGKAEAAETSRGRGHHAGLGLAVTSIVSVLLLVKGMHGFYWLMIWDGTVDPLGDFWLFLPMFAILVAGAFLVTAFPGKLKVTGVIYFLLVIALLMGVVDRAKHADFRQLTEERAARTVQALETYYGRHEHYPQDLKQLVPWPLLSIPGPVIIFGQRWCYGGGDNYYRLGYVDREHWSDPRLVSHIYETRGDFPQHQPICAEEITALRERQPGSP